MLLIKQALPLELQFYQAVTAAAEPELDALRPFIPKFLGTLALEGELDADKPASETTINVKPMEGPRKDEWSQSRPASRAYWLAHSPSSWKISRTRSQSPTF